jgi:hypothetical protein
MASSISSMTGGSRVAEGPTTKITCRTDKDFILKQTPTNTKLDEYDVSKVRGATAAVRVRKFGATDEQSVRGVVSSMRFAWARRARTRRRRIRW